MNPMQDNTHSHTLSTPTAHSAFPSPPPQGYTTFLHTHQPHPYHLQTSTHTTRPCKFPMATRLHSHHPNQNPTPHNPPVQFPLLPHAYTYTISPTATFPHDFMPTPLTFHSNTPSLYLITVYTTNHTLTHLVTNHHTHPPIHQLSSHHLHQATDNHTFHPHYFPTANPHSYIPTP